MSAHMVDVFHPQEKLQNTAVPPNDEVWRIDIMPSHPFSISRY
jgi:hypothetical protein